MSQTILNFSFLGKAFFTVVFFPLFYLTPYGYSFGDSILWLNDVILVLSVLVIFFILLLFRLHFIFFKFQIPISFFFILLFFSLEFFFPLFGVFIWDDISSASSSLRACLYWLPFLLVFYVFKPSNESNLETVERLILYAVVLNVVMGLMELAIFFNIFPVFMDFRQYVAAFAPQERFLRQNIISFGFFQNSTAYAVFGYLALIHCFSRLLELDRNKVKYFIFSILSFAIIVLSTSRTPLAAAFISASLCLFFLRRTPQNLVFSVILASLGVFVFFSLFSADLSLFSRFTRLVEGGIENDYSLNMRITEVWPNALGYYFDLGHPTFTNPTKYVGTIDSGYLTYLIQGGWVMLATTVLMFVYFIFSSFFKIVFKSSRNYFNYFLLFLSIYCSLGMVISNPLRNPIVIAFLCFAVFGFASRKYNGVKA